jgi:hypothetical protein
MAKLLRTSECELLQDEETLFKNEDALTEETGYTLEWGCGGVSNEINSVNNVHLFR